MPAHTELAHSSLHPCCTGHQPGSLHCSTNQPNSRPSATQVAAPLFADEQRTQYRGFVDLLDIVAAVVAAARQPSTPTAGSAHALRARAPAAARQVSKLVLRCWSPQCSSVAAWPRAAFGKGQTSTEQAPCLLQVAAQPVGSIRAMDNDAQLVFQAQLGNSLLEVCECGSVNAGAAAPCPVESSLGARAAHARLHMLLHLRLCRWCERALPTLWTSSSATGEPLR